MGFVAYLLQIHSFHRRIHPPYHIRHAACDLTHRHGCLYPTAYGIDAACKPKKVQLLVLFPDRILCIDFCDISVILLYSLIVGEVDVSKCDRWTIVGNDMTWRVDGKEDKPSSACSFLLFRPCQLSQLVD